MMTRRKLWGWLLCTSTILALPTMGEAAVAAAVFGEVSTAMEAATGLCYLVGVFFLTWLGVKALRAFYANREEGEWLWYLFGAVGGAAFSFIVLPRLIAPGIALAATPEMLNPPALIEIVSAEVPR